MTNFSNVAADTSLNGGITAAATTLTVVSSTGYPTVPFNIQIESEIVRVAAASGNDFTSLTRGYDGTTAAVHNSGVSVQHVVVAEDMTTAFHDNVDGEIDAVTAKTAAVAADVLLIEDSAATLAKKKVLRSGLFPFIDSPVGATLMGISAGAVNTDTYTTAFGYQALFGNTIGALNNAFGHKALFSNTTGSKNVAIGYIALQANTTGSFSIAIGQATLSANTTGGSHTAIGYRALFAPSAVIANATTTALRQTAIGQETGQASATQRNDIVAVGYRALIDANDTVAVGSGAQALHANAVALGKGIVTTAASQIAVGATHIEMSEQTAPGVGAANTGRLYLVDNGSGKTQLMIQFATGAAIQVAIEA